MCGIVGYVGDKKTVSLIIEGLKKLEYRGYDSAGLALVEDGKIKVYKKKGFIKELEKVLPSLNSTGLGIGHTRWATHGRPSDENAHPHLDCREEIALVHNGIIENFLFLKEELEEKGHIFKSQTDTEVIVHLIEENYQGNLLEAVRKAIKRLKGSFALAVISSREPEKLVVARQDSPLVIGLGASEKLIASDIPALLKHTREVLILENGEMAELKKDEARIYTFEGEEIQKNVFRVTWEAEAAEKGGFEDFMMKEMHEQPEAVRETYRGRVREDGTVCLDESNLELEEIKKLKRVILVACGSSFYASLTGALMIEAYAKLPANVEISSEFRYREPLISKNSLVIAVTQSGETADTLASLRQAKACGAKVITVTNVVGSSASREADGIIYTHAGPEICVLATKTLTSQITALAILALHLGQARGVISRDEILKVYREIERIPEKIEQVLSKREKIKDLAEKFYGYQSFLFLGRGAGLPVALEGALKLKEVSYIHAEGYPAGEMKHGPIALIDETTPVLAVATQGVVYEKVLGNIEEVKARDGIVIAVVNPGDEEVSKVADYLIEVPTTPELLSPLVSVVPLQLFAYYIAKKRGLNVDQPRNLAKSVTVE